MRDQWPRALMWGAVPLATLALACMPMLGMRAMVAVIAAWLLLLLTRAFIDPVPVGRAHLRWTLFLALPFLLMLVDIPRAPDLASGWKCVERSAALLLFPIGFLLLRAPASRGFRDAMVDVFSGAAVILALYANIGIAVSDVPADIRAEPGYAYNYRAMFSAVTSLHPPYAAYYLLSSALFQITRVLDGAKARNWRISAVILLFLAAALLASRMPLFAFVAAATPVLLMRLPKRSSAIVAISALALPTALIALTPNARQRVAEIFRSTSAPMSEDEVTSTNIRLTLAYCSEEAIRAHWLLGTGQANAQATLDACYGRFNIPLLLDGSYGTHDQPLHWWLCFGIAGLLLFVAYFGRLLLSAWRARDLSHLAFLIFLLLCMLTENVLARQWGVVLFACLNALFIATRLEATTAPPGGRQH